MTDGILGLFAAHRGHFPFESGHHGTLWLDIDQAFMRAAEMRRLTANLAFLLARYDISAVCGPLVGGALVAQGVAAGLDLQFCYTERIPSTLPGGLHSVRYELPAGHRSQLAGARIAVVDDVINAGSAVLATIAALEACGAAVVVAASLLLLGDTATARFRAINLPWETLTHIENELWLPAVCPLCAARIPLNSPS